MGDQRNIRALPLIGSRSTPCTEGKGVEIAATRIVRTRPPRIDCPAVLSRMELAWLDTLRTHFTRPP